MGGPLGFEAPKEMEIGFEGREEEEGGSAEGMLSNKGVAFQENHKYNKTS